MKLEQWLEQQQMIQRSVIISPGSTAHTLQQALNVIRELQVKFEHIKEYWNQSENQDAMSDALYHFLDVADEALDMEVPE